MSNTKTTKRALLCSIMSLIICFAMLIGTTFAWFTDSVSSTGNKIQAGTLNIKMFVKEALETEYADVETMTDPIFDYDKWEPGYTVAKNIKVSTDGNLALKYTLKITAKGEVSKLAEVIDVYYAASEVAVADRALNGLTKIGTLKDVLDGVDGTIINDTLIPGSNTEDYATLALKMQETAGNEYQGLSIGSSFDLNLVAAQHTYEKDSFDDQYDVNAEYPVVVANNTEAQSSIMTGTNSGTAAGNPIVNVITSNDITLDLDANGGYYNATLGGTDSENVTVDANGNKITFDSSYRNAINCYGKLTISNAELDSTYKTEGSTWDDYALIFKYKENGANEVVFNNVTFDRQVAIEKGVKATFNNCTINQTAATGDMYALWICAGADVTLNGCTINSINPNAGSKNRAIKIADEYVDAPTLTKLSVAGTTFKSQKKAAVLVTSVGGANIVWGAGNNISAVDADSTNAVWNDSARATYNNLVTVSGCTKIQEQ